MLYRKKSSNDSEQCLYCRGLCLGRPGQKFGSFKEVQEESFNSDCWRRSRDNGRMGRRGHQNDGRAGAKKEGPGY